MDHSATMATLYEGWHTYQRNLIAVLRPLSAEQLALSTNPSLRSVGDTVTHMIGARARWFYLLLEEGGATFADLGTWDRPEMPQRTAAELIDGLETSWRIMHEAIGRWTPEEWAQTYPGEDESEPELITRAWVIWHLIEHDLHHGGEIGITLGAHQIPSLDL